MNKWKFLFKCPPLPSHSSTHGQPLLSTLFHLNGPPFHGSYDLSQNTTKKPVNITCLCSVRFNQNLGKFLTKLEWLFSKKNPAFISSSIDSNHCSLALLIFKVISKRAQIFKEEMFLGQQEQHSSLGECSFWPRRRRHMQRQMPPG